MLFDKMIDGDNKQDFISRLSERGQLEYDRRLNETFEDIVRLGYHQKINWFLVVFPTNQA